ncbi:Fur-regulated basic protein FbpA [Oceanobacillus oncorhynchi]|uniref:Fur-regulated basic protein FbpA n=1 Tax=Oceanobacillus oncorhynchi TaxID=545501 RepID=UPI0018662501|nr:Fur-regulated basic protein FbpA [Oceanobacillus oncorhynchi]
MSDIEVQKRKSELIKKLRRIGIYQTSDGRKLEDCSFYTVLWNYIDVKCKEGKLLSEE